MTVANLKNVIIKKLEDKNFNPYYLIVNNDNLDEVYFCFEKTVREGWSELVQNWERIKEVEIEFEEKEQNLRTYRRVVSIYIPQEGEVFI
jgi:hypothetical protein